MEGLRFVSGGMLMYHFLESERVSELEDEAGRVIVANFGRNDEILVGEGDFLLEDGLRCFWEKNLEKLVRMVKQAHLCGRWLVKEAGWFYNSQMHLICCHSIILVAFD